MTVRRTLKTPRKTADWSKFDAMTDTDVQTAVSNDPDAAPIHRIADPVERVVASALDAAGVRYTHQDIGNAVAGQLDFALPNGVQIECKRFHAARVVDQMAAHENVIVIQGMKAAKTFQQLLWRARNGDVMIGEIQEVPYENLP